MGQAVQHAPAADTVHYERRRPEDTTLYRPVGEHLETFLAQVEAQTGAALPQFVKDEFDAYLMCGILAHGFARLRSSRLRPGPSGSDPSFYAQRFFVRTQSIDRSVFRTYPPILKKGAVQGMTPVASSPEAFAQAIREDSERWAKVVDARKLSAN